MNGHSEVFSIIPTRVEIKLLTLLIYRERNHGSRTSPRPIMVHKRTAENVGGRKSLWSWLLADVGDDSLKNLKKNGIALSKNITRSALDKQELSDMKGREIEKKAANVQMSGTVGVV